LIIIIFNRKNYIVSRQRTRRDEPKLAFVILQDGNVAIAITSERKQLQIVCVLLARDIARDISVFRISHLYSY